MSQIIVPGEENTPIDMNSAEVASKIAELKEKLGITDEPEELTPEAIAARNEAARDAEVSGKDVDWSEYELDPNYSHFYSRAKLIETPEGPKWAVEIDEFKSATKNCSGGSMNKIGEPSDLGAYITWMVNGPERWQIATVLPNGISQTMVLLQRKVRVSLPDPIPLVTETEVTAPTDSELDAAEKSGMAWAAATDAEHRIQVPKTSEDEELVQARFENMVEGKDFVSIATAEAKKAVRVWEQVEKLREENDQQEGDGESGKEERTS